MMLDRRLLFSGASAIAAGAAFPRFARAQPTSNSWAGVMDRKTLRIGAAILEPWYFKDTTSSPAPGGVEVDGTVWRGICPLLGKAVADAMGVKLQIVETTWSNAVAALQADQIDCMFMLDPTPQRALAVDFVPTPMLWYPLAALTRDDANFSDWKDLNDAKWRIAVALGTNGDEFLTGNVPKATITRYQNSGEIFAAFQAGRADVAMVSAVAADIARGRLKKGKVIVPKPAIAIPGGIAVRKEPDRRFFDYLNTVGGYFYTTGKTQQFYEEFLSFRGIDPKSAISVMRETW